MSDDNVAVVTLATKELSLDAPEQKPSRSLPELVQSLPQEIFDQIYEDVIAWAPQSVIVVDKDNNFDHPATSLLQVNRAIRSKLLGAFFSNIRQFVLEQEHGEPMTIEYSCDGEGTSGDISRPHRQRFRLRPRSRSDIRNNIKWNDRARNFGEALKQTGLVSGVDWTQKGPFWRGRPLVRLYFWGTIDAVSMQDARLQAAIEEESGWPLAPRNAE